MPLLNPLSWPENNPQIPPALHPQTKAAKVSHRTCDTLEILLVYYPQSRTPIQTMRAPKMQAIEKALQHDFRQNIEEFYATLKLAPPYHSVEKAVTCLSTLLHEKTAEEQQEISQDQGLKWKLYQQAFIESGLSKKHRGIISGLAQTQKLECFSQEHRYFLEPFLLKKNQASSPPVL